MSFGRPYILEIAGCIHDGWLVLKPDYSRLNQDYLYYALSSPEAFRQFDRMAAGSTVRNLNIGIVSQVKIPLPSLDEQKRIVAVLDQAVAALDRARAHIEANVADAFALLAETRERLLDPNQPGWRSRSLSELISIKHGFAFKSEYFTNDGAYVLLTPGNFFEDGGFRDRGEKQKYYVGDIPDGFILNEGDLLMAMTEQAPGLLGSCILVPASNSFLHNQRLGRIHSVEGVEWHSPYFAHVFNLKRFRKALSDTCTGIKVRHTSPDKIKAVTVPMPSSMDEQKNIANQIDELSNWTKQLELHYSTKLERIANLRQSLLQKAFSGQLV